MNTRISGALALVAIALTGCGSSHHSSSSTATTAAPAAAAPSSTTTAAPSPALVTFPGTVVATEQPDPSHSTLSKVVAVGPSGKLTPIAQIPGKPQEYPAPALSADKQRVAYEDLHTKIHVVGIDGSGSSVLVTDPNDPSDPNWAPDGKHLAYDIVQGPDRETIHVDDVATGKTRRLTAKGKHELLPRYLPDGRIVFDRFSGSNDRGDVMIVDSDGSHLRKLTNTPKLNEVDPAPSPDGTMVAITTALSSDRPGSSPTSSTVEIIDLQGHVLHHFKAGPNDTVNGWSSDGTKLLLTSTRTAAGLGDPTSEHFGLWETTLDGGSPAPVATLPGPGIVSSGPCASGPARGGGDTVSAPEQLLVTLLRADARVPARSRAGDAGYDLRCVEDVELAPGERALVPTGLAIAVPAGFAGLVLPRSGLALRDGVTTLNAPGLIDPNYRGELRVILHNAGSEPFHAAAGERIAQLLLVPTWTPELTVVDTLPPSGDDRGEHGFGSSGRH